MRAIKNEILIDYPIDFAALSAAYKAAKWSWHKEGIPTPASIEKTIAMLKNYAEAHSDYCATGGITVYNGLVFISPRLHRHYAPAK